MTVYMENLSSSDQTMTQLDIPCGTGILKLFTVAPELFTVILGLEDDFSTSDGRPRITIKSGKDNNFFLFLQNPNRKIEDCECVVESKLLNVFLRKISVDFVCTKDVIFDILNYPYYYANFCGLTDKEKKEELEKVFGCDLFTSSDVLKIPCGDMFILADKFKNMLKEDPDADPKLIKISLQTISTCKFQRLTIQSATGNHVHRMVLEGILLTGTLIER